MIVMRRPRTMALVLALAAAWAVACAALTVAMARPATFGAVMQRLPMPVLALFPVRTMLQVACGGKLEPGHPAPDFELPTVDGARRVRLSSLRGKPVLLIFGSFT